MPILNLTPHPIALFHLDNIPAEPQFYRTSAGWLRVGRKGQFDDVLPLGYQQWDPQPVPARVAENRTDVELLQMRETEDYNDGHGSVSVVRTVPVRSVVHGPVTGLPEPTPGTFLIVSLPVVTAARAHGRRTDDLLTPGDLVRSPEGEIAGVTSFYRW